MNVLFAPFRDKNLNPKSWDQKIKFWSELIVNHCKENKLSFITLTSLKEIFRRKGKSPACLETVITEMKRNGTLKTESYFLKNSNEGWLSWGYKTLVKNPLGWSKQLVTGPPSDNLQEDLIVIDVIKIKAELLLQDTSRPGSQTGLVEYHELREHATQLCPSDQEFDIVMQHLAQSQQVVIQQSDNKTKLVKFLHQQKATAADNPQIDEKDVHTHRIQKAHSHVKKQIEEMSKEVESLGAEAVSQKQEGKLKLALSTMRRRRLAINRLDKLTGALDNLDDLLYRIKQAESNEMIVRAMEGGASLLRDAVSRTSAEEVAHIMDSVAEMSQLQDDMNSDLQVSSVEEPSQSELEDELVAILKEGYTPTKAYGNDKADESLEDELKAILKEDGQTGGSEINDTAELDKLLEGLDLPDVPKSPPSRTTTQKSRIALTS